MRSERFDILAKMPEGAGRDKLPEMLQSLLAERFHLRFHHETKEMPVFALTVGKTGARLADGAAENQLPSPPPAGASTLYTPQGEAYIDANRNPVITSGPYGPIRGGRGASGMTFQFGRITMPAFAEVITPHVDRPVVDMTGLKGSYRIEVAMEPPDGPPGGGRKDGSAPSPDAPRPPDIMWEGMQRMMEKSGLKLEPRKAPVDTMVVDHLEKTATEN